MTPLVLLLVALAVGALMYGLASGAASRMGFAVFVVALVGLAYMVAVRGWSP